MHIHLYIAKKRRKNISWNAKEEYKKQQQKYVYPKKDFEAKESRQEYEYKLINIESIIIN